MTPDEFFAHFATTPDEERFTRSLDKILAVTLQHDHTTDLWAGDLHVGFRTIQSRHGATGVTVEAVAEQLDRVVDKYVANQYTNTGDGDAR